MTDGKRATGDRFDEAATAYLESDTHRQGDDLDTLASWCGGADRALDVATGAGHTAGALMDRGIDRVVAADGAPVMVATATETYGVEGCVADAERLPFADDSFDAVTCRIAAHHFPTPTAFVAEVARVLVGNGVFAFEDNVAPDDESVAEFIDRVERRRDPSHVELVAPTVWQSRFESAGFVIEAVEAVHRRLDFEAWCDRMTVEKADRARLRRWFADAPAGARTALDCRFDDDGVESFVVPKRLFRLRNGD